MIMGDKCLSVILHSDGGKFNSQTLEVWFKVLKGYKHGGELILVSFGGDGETEFAFQEKHAEDGIRIVSIVSDEPFNWTNLMRSAYEYVAGNYIWCSANYTYPNGDITGEIVKHLDDETLFILNGIYISSPFDYSTMHPLVREPNDVIFRPPCIDIESFTVQSKAFKDFAAILRNQGINGSHVANAWRDLVGINWEYSEKATVFIVNNL